MDSVHNIRRDSYRLIVTRRDASELLLVPCGSSWSLPSVEIMRGGRIAEQLTAELCARYGCQSYCLFVPTAASELARCAIMEVPRGHETGSVSNCWQPLTVATFSSPDSTDDRAAIEKAVEELNSFRTEPIECPFARPGWLAELLEWVEQQVSPLGLRLTGDFTQLNAAPTFSLIRLETNAVAVWFKATGKPNRHELPIAACLTRLFPEYVPRLLGVHAAWNGWLTEEVSGASPDHFADLSGWTKAAQDLAQLQILSMGKQADLLEGQCKDLRLPRLIEQIDPFMVRMREFMAIQEKQTPAPLMDAELTLLGNRLKQACASLGEVGLPDTLGHLDFNPQNILVSPERCVFLDWAEACVTNPLITFEYLREHFRRTRGSDLGPIERLGAAYLRPWQSVDSLTDWKRATVVSPLVAAFACAAAADGWRSPETLTKRSHAGYLRSLTRRMHREAEQIAQRSEPCFA
jgi:hypothetical protein